MRNKSVFSFAIAALSTLLLATTSVAETFENPKVGAMKWKVVDYNLVTTHPARIPDKITGGIEFDFLFTPDTAVVGTSHPSYRNDLIGDMSSRPQLKAVVDVDVTAGTTFTYYGEGTPDNPCSRPANVRFYFQTNTSGKFEPTDYWWSNPMSADLEALKTVGATLTANLANAAEWSDWDGHGAASNAAHEAAFNAAVQDVQFIGLSFGGGCFFQNGVGIVPGSGSGTFRLMEFSAAP